MGNKKKKYNARFPPARIKKIMQTDEEVGKMAAAVPVVISRALELFLASMITKTASLATEGNAKTLTASHVKAVVEGDSSFDFLKSLVVNVPELSSTAQRQDSIEMSSKLPSSEPKPKRKKSTAPSTVIAESSDQSNPPKKRRGRPPKDKAGNEKETLNKPYSSSMCGIEESSSAAAFAPNYNSSYLDKPSTSKYAVSLLYPNPNAAGYSQVDPTPQDEPTDLSMNTARSTNRSTQDEEDMDDETDSEDDDYDT